MRTLNFQGARETLSLSLSLGFGGKLEVSSEVMPEGDWPVFQSAVDATAVSTHPAAPLAFESVDHLLAPPLSRDSSRAGSLSARQLNLLHLLEIMDYLHT